MKKYLLITSILALASSAQAKELHDTKAQAAKLCGSNQSKELYNSKQKVSEVAPKDHQIHQDNDLGNQGKVFFGIDGGWSMFPKSDSKYENGLTISRKGSPMISGSIGYFISPTFAMGVSLDYMPSYKIISLLPDVDTPQDLNLQKITDIKETIKLSNLIGMLDFYYHPITNSQVSPYITLGLGMARFNIKSVSNSAVEVDRNGTKTLDSNSEDISGDEGKLPNRFLCQVGAGALYNLNESVKLNIAAKLKFDPKSLSKKEDFFGLVNLTAGIRYHF